MPYPEGQTCKTCLHFVPIEMEPEEKCEGTCENCGCEDVAIGFCQGSFPTYNRGCGCGNGTGMGVWPVIPETEVCGQWKSSEPSLFDGLLG